jgi:hypothetical protein
MEHVSNPSAKAWQRNAFLIATIDAAVEHEREWREKDGSWTWQRTRIGTSRGLSPALRPGAGNRITPQVGATIAGG